MLFLESNLKKKKLRKPSFNKGILACLQKSIC